MKKIAHQRKLIVIIKITIKLLIYHINCKYFIILYKFAVEIVNISLITVSYNAAETIQKCIDSVRMQSYAHIEHIIIDGNSSDKTLDIINANMDGISVFKSEADLGIYDAMNKGIRMATGSVVGMLNADDYLANEHVLKDIAQLFKSTDTDIVYADLDYLNKKGEVVRKWRSGKFSSSRFNFGWMPPHPTFYARKECFDKFGLYQLNYGTAADYELMLRFMYRKPVKVTYLNKVTVNMVAGGVSNSTFKNRFKAWKGDWKAMRANHLRIPMLSLPLKPLRKIIQFYI